MGFYRGYLKSINVTRSKFRSIRLSLIQIIEQKSVSAAPIIRTILIGTSWTVELVLEKEAGSKYSDKAVIVRVILLIVQGGAVLEELLPWECRA